MRGDLAIGPSLEILPPAPPLPPPPQKLPLFARLSAICARNAVTLGPPEVAGVLVEQEAPLPPLRPASTRVPLFALWLTFAGLASVGSPSPAVRVFEALSFAPCCAAGCLFRLALFVRFANRRIRAFDALGDKAYGMYLVHYLFSVWLQFLLLGVAAAVKAAFVFLGTVGLSFGMVALIQRALTVAWVERKPAPGTAAPSNVVVLRANSRAS